MFNIFKNRRKNYDIHHKNIAFLLSKDERVFRRKRSKIHFLKEDLEKNEIKFINTINIFSHK